MKTNQYDEIFEKEWVVCGKTLLASKTGNGECPHCGWYNNRLGEIHEDKVIFPNLISLNKAKTLCKEWKPFRPDFEDFIDGYNFYGEMEFTYKGITYGLMGVENVGVEFWGMNTDKYEIYKDIEEFEQKAHINENF